LPSQAALKLWLNWRPCEIMGNILDITFFLHILMDKEQCSHVGDSQYKEAVQKYLQHMTQRS
jgi:hypothetical protein